MKVWSKTAVALAALLAAACTGQVSHPESAQPVALDRACLAVVAAKPGNDKDIKRLQGNLRAHRDALAAEHLGYRFVARARLANNTGDYAVAEQAAACLESITPNEPAGVAPARPRAAPDASLQRGRVIARRLVATA